MGWRVYYGKQVNTELQTSNILGRRKTLGLGMMSKPGTPNAKSLSLVLGVLC